MKGKLEHAAISDRTEEKQVRGKPKAFDDKQSERFFLLQPCFNHTICLSSTNTMKCVRGPRPSSGKTIRKRKSGYTNERAPNLLELVVAQTNSYYLIYIYVTHFKKSKVKHDATPHNVYSITYW